MKISTKLVQLQRIAPKASRYGQLYRDSVDTTKAYKRVTLYTLFVSDDNEHMLRPHIFKKQEAMTPAQWYAWFQKHLEKIHREAILPALSVRTDLSKPWAVQSIIGWKGDAKYASRNPKARASRHSSQQSRRQDG